MLLLAALVAFPGCVAFSDHREGRAVPARPAPPMHRGADRRVETVMRGRIEGVPWRLTAYRDGQGACVDVHLERNSGGGCGFGRMGDRDLMVHGSSWFQELAGFAIVDGEVSAEVDELILRSSGGEERVDLHHAKTLDGEVFVAFIPVGGDAVLIARNKKGKELDRHPFSVRELAP